MVYYIPSLDRFGQLLDLTKKTYFLNSLFVKIRKFPYELLTFFQGKLYQKFFSSQSLPTLPWEHSIPSLVQFGQLYDLIKETYFSKLFKINYSKQISVSKTNFFLGKL